MVLRISTEQYMDIQAKMMLLQLELLGGKTSPVAVKQSVDALLEVNGCVVINTVNETEESRRKELEGKLKL